MTVTFNAPASIGTSPILSYTAKTTYLGTTFSISGLTTTLTIPGLPNGATFTVLVTATNKVGTGPASLPSNIVVLPTLPGAPTNVSPTAGNRQITVNFNAPVSNGGLPITQYAVTVNPGNIVVRKTSSPILISGLTNGVTYTLSVTATNAVGTGLASAPVLSVGLVVPAPASNLLATNSVLSTSRPTVTLTWRDNSNNEGGFMIQRSSTTSFTGATVFTVGPNITTFIDSTIAVNAPAPYSYRVYAFNGFGNATQASNVASLTSVGRLPAAPTNLAITNRSRTSISLSWTDNSSNETKFVLQWGVTNSGTGVTTWTLVTLPVNTTTFIHNGLTNNTRYSYRVKAANLSGSSAWTPILSTTTLP